MCAAVGAGGNGSGAHAPAGSARLQSVQTGSSCGGRHAARTTAKSREPRRST